MSTLLNFLAYVALLGIGLLLTVGLFALVGKAYISYLQDLRNYIYDKRAFRFRSNSK
jgi:hypothetical protein